MARARIQLCWIVIVAALLSLAADRSGPAIAADPPKRKVVLPGPADASAYERKAAAPAAPADFRSPHFLVHTDLPPRDARKLLGKLETMLSLVSKYWGQPPVGIIECYVVGDLKAWPEGSLDAAGRAKIVQGAGITHVDTITRGPELVSAKAVVYAVADRGTPQHEAVHAYCGQTFGRTGPLWYSEGMAEMGQYWRQGDPSVHCPQYVIDYLRSARPKPVRHVIAEDGSERPGAGPSRTGDSWQNYAWRWALCHLLAENPNYSDRFRPLGLGYLTGAPVSFAQTYGAMIDEIEFEYNFFVKHADAGFRADLCSWNWNRKFRAPTSDSAVPSRVAAKGGWQPSGALLRGGQPYDYSARGVWQIGPERRDLTADGSSDGAGRLEGVIFHDYTLGEPFALSASGTLVAPADGRLYLRCRDRWNELADNSGFVAFKIRRSASSDALPGPGETAETPGPADAD